MGKYQGVEQGNIILEFIRRSPYPGHPTQSLELPNLQNVYQLWNAAKQGSVSFLPSGEAQEWFGHSLFTANIKIYMGWVSLFDILNLFSSSPRRPVPLGSHDATYQPADEPYSDPELQIERYSSFSTFLWHLAGALDVMTMGLAFLYDFEAIRTTFGISLRRIEPLKIHFSTGISLLREVGQATSFSHPQLQNLINVFKDEKLLDIVAPNKTGCHWYEDLKGQRNYYTHVAFPRLYMINGEWRIPKDIRSTSTSKPIDPVTFCPNLFEKVYHFIGKVYGGVWADFSPLP